MLSLASWDPAREHLRTWIARRIVEEYPSISLDGAQRLVANRQVLPILDGLDEIAPTRRFFAFRAIARAVRGGDPIILTCRSEEYAEAAEKVGIIDSAAVLTAEELAPPVVLAHLRRSVQPGALPRWQRFLDHLAAGPSEAVTTTFRTPLVVSLLRSVYEDPHREPTELLDPVRFPTVGSIENHLLDAIIPTAFEDGPTYLDPQRPPSRRWSRKKAERWLTFLAATMTEAWTTVIGAVAMGLAAGFMTRPFLPKGDPRKFIDEGDEKEIEDDKPWLIVLWLLIGVPVAWLGVLFFIWLIGGKLAPVDLYSASIPRPGEHYETKIDFTWKFIFGTTGLTLLTAGLGALFLFRPYLTAVPDATKGRPGKVAIGQAIRAAAVTSVLVGALFAVSFLGMTVILGASDFGIGLATLTALAVALLTYCQTSFGAYFRASRQLAMIGRLPWRLNAFLEDAHQAGVLRQAGTVYQFRHARLRDRLATRVR
ncbi:hypothetical protein F0L68_36605 [Solihabitans fulvus]|uniref:NACHT domain-containing protein n=1 Tax=Solihabitans fulvus TaxID=1892852 RepID=A0A5B2WP32_9PSEU|nr:hypothetical protein [Solihabitans fulvus]KAA2252256.1 hypothetical protein F0L68_36605 [Solihabitans fulvus]